MKFRDIEDKFEMLKTTFSLLGYRVVTKSYCCGVAGEWLDFLSVVRGRDLYEINFVSNKNAELEATYIREFKLHRNNIKQRDWKKVKSVFYPTEDQIDEVIGFFIAEIGDD